MKIYRKYDLLKSVLNDSDYHLEDYKILLDRLYDEQSKINLFYRVMFDNTNDAYYALMLEKMMYYYSPFFSVEDKEFFEYIQFLLNNKNYQKKMYIVGLPYYHDGVIWNLLTYIVHRRGGLNIQSIFDDVCELDFIDVDGIHVPILSLEELFCLDIDEDSIFIIANCDYDYIRDYLLDQNEHILQNIFIFRNISRCYRYIQYFCEPFLKLCEHEVFVDGGASDLDTTAKFIDYVGGKYDKIYAFEPLLDDYERGLHRLNMCQYKNVELYNYGLWDSDSVIGFERRENGSSSVVIDDTNKIHTCSIDKLLNNEPVSLIKLDIEGAEYNAIVGAKRTIEMYSPVLMICVYHHPNDVFRLSNLVLSINSSYKIFLRHYAFSIYETVMYFIPQTKLITF